MKKKSLSELSHEDVEPTETPASELDQAEMDRINEILTANDVNGGFIRLERKGPFDVNWAYLTKIPVEKFDIDMIKNSYGGGDYRAKTFRSNGQMYRPFEFKIDHRIKGGLDEPSKEKSGSDPDKLVKAVADAIAQKKDETPHMLKVMELSSQKSDQLMMLMMQQQQRSAELMMTLITSMMQVMGNNRNDNTPLLMKLIEQKAEPAKTDLMSTLEVIKAIKDMETQPEEPDMFTKGISMIMPMIGGLVNKGNPPIEVQPKQIDQVPTNDPRMIMVNQFKARILEQARLGGAHEPILNIIEQFISEDDMKAIKELLQKDDWRALFFGNVTLDDKSIAWLEKLKQLLLNDQTQETLGSFIPPNSSP